MERSTRGLRGAVACLAVVPALIAAQPGTAGPPDKGERPATTKKAAREWERAHRATRIIGTDVRTATGERIGDIKDLVIDREGRVVLAIVSTGGFLGIGDRMHAVPWSALRPGDKHDRVIDLDRKRLGDVPSIGPRDWPDMSDEKWLEENRRRFSR